MVVTAALQKKDVNTEKVWLGGTSEPTVPVSSCSDIYFQAGIKGETLVEVLKVSAKSNPKSVAGALTAVLRDNGSAEIQAVGASAVNQAIKAIAITRGFIAPNGIDLVAIPAFVEIAIDGEERTAIKFIVEPR